MNKPKSHREIFPPLHSLKRFSPSAAGLYLVLGLAATPLLSSAQPESALPSVWPQEYAVYRDESSGLLTLSNSYYTVQHDLKRGGAISRISLRHGKAPNLLVRPIHTAVRDEDGTFYTDLGDRAARVSHHRNDMTESVVVESRLLDEQDRAAGLEVKTAYEYHWGYIKIHREFRKTPGDSRLRQLSPFSTILISSLSDYGYREGITEQEGAPSFSFGSNRWGKLRGRNDSDPYLRTPYLPRSIMLADAGMEGLEWFAGSDLTQWDQQLTGTRGQGLCLLQSSRDPAGFSLSISPLHSTNKAVVLPKSCMFDFYLGIPLLEGHARKPWLHTSFNRNQGHWVSPEQVRRWAESGIQTVHCHNDGDYYNDGLFWRDGSYPPYPDMERYDKVIADCQAAGIRVATYFSNKELHPSTKEFQEHGEAWGRKDRKGQLQHNFFREKSEFGVQMCLRSGWLDFLKLSIDRVLKNHRLDGVYYDWNVALYCCNGLHEGKADGSVAAGHWDIDELLDLMEWTRRRVGPRGLVIIHNTTTPMFVMENFADYVVANEWGYGKWTDQAPDLQNLPLEWNLVGARSRGVISYGQISEQSPRRMHRLFALESLLGGVTPWPASPETFELFSLLKPLGDIENYRFVDWRNSAVSLQGARCASAIYSKPGESYILLANLDKNTQEARCLVHPDKLPYPLKVLTQASIVQRNPEIGSVSATPAATPLDAGQLTSQGVKIAIPPDGAVLLLAR